MARTASAPKAPNYSEADEAFIRARAAEGPLNQAAAASIAEALGKTPRSVIAKINRMGLDYVTKQPVTKTGEPVASKATIVQEISGIVAGNLDGLEKAPKAALYALRAFALANASGE